jgi:hypothetical protein
LYFFTINAWSETGFGGVAGALGVAGGVAVLGDGVAGAGLTEAVVEAGGVEVVGTGSEEVVEEHAALTARLKVMRLAQQANRVVPMSSSVAVNHVDAGKIQATVVRSS